MAQATKKFADYFWDDKDAGFATLMERMKAAKHTCVELADLFKARADMEEDFGKRLMKMSKSTALGKDETGSIKKSLDVFKVEVEEHGKSKLELAEAIRSQLEKPLDTFMNQQREVRKEHQNNMERSQKNRQVSASALIKAEERFKARSAELDGLNEQKTSVKSKEVEKLEGKIQKAIAALNTADQEYLNASDKLREAHTQWVKDMFAACEAFQKLEEERIDFLRNIMWAYANANSNGSVKDDECFERLRKALETCDVVKDINEFIERCKTGTTIPEIPEYHGLNKADPRSAKKPQQQMTTTPLLQRSSPSPILKTGPAKSTPSDVFPPPYAASLTKPTDIQARIGDLQIESGTQQSNNSYNPFEEGNPRPKASAPPVEWNPFD